LRRDKLTLIALTILIVLTALSLFAGVISDMMDVNYRTTEVSNAFEPLKYHVTIDGEFPFVNIHSRDSRHILGTDDIGRDHLSRLLYAGRVSMGIAIGAGALSLIIGASVGVFAGYYQGGKFGFLDDLIMWVVTTLNSVPYIFLLLVISAILSPSVISLILILAVLSWTGTMRLMRGETLARREHEYVIAARAIGSTDARVMFSHIMPNVFSILIINLALDIGTFILVESALSFLNLGVRPPTPSWGNMLTNAQSFFTRSTPLFVIPGVLIVVTVLCLYVVGDGVRDAFDPQSVKKK
jgi:peptide/nickel transport system permease protein